MSGREAPEIGSTDPGAPWKDGVTPSTSNGLAAFPCAWATMASSRAKSKTPGAVSRFGQYTLLVVRSKAPTEAAGNVVPSSGACMPKNREVTAVPWLVVISRLVDVPCAGAAPVATAPPVTAPRARTIAAATVAAATPRPVTEPDLRRTIASYPVRQESFTVAHGT